MYITVTITIAFILLAIDWRQTLRIAREPERFSEAWNLVLPEHPSVAQVHLYFAAVAILFALALWYAPQLRVPFGLLGVIVEAAAVVNNFRKGIKP